MKDNTDISVKKNLEAQNSIKMSCIMRHLLDISGFIFILDLQKKSKLE